MMTVWRTNHGLRKSVIVSFHLHSPPVSTVVTTITDSVSCGLHVFLYSLRHRLHDQDKSNQHKNLCSFAPSSIVEVRETRRYLAPHPRSSANTGVVALARAYRELFQKSGEKPRAELFDAELLQALKTRLPHLSNGDQAIVQWLMASIE